MEKIFFTSWAILNVFIYALLFSIYIFAYIRLRNRKILFIALNAFIVIYLCYVNFRSGSTDPSLSSDKRNYHVNRVFTKQFIQVENLGAGNLSMLLSYNADSIYHQQSRLYGIALGHLWHQKSIHAHIANNRVFYSIQGEMQWRLLGCLVYSQPKHLEENVKLLSIN